jgi:hypothetical protein
MDCEKSKAPRVVLFTRTNREAEKATTDLSKRASFTVKESV